MIRSDQRRLCPSSDASFVYLAALTDDLRVATKTRTAPISPRTKPTIAHSQTGIPHASRGVFSLKIRAREKQTHNPTNVFTHSVELEVRAPKSTMAPRILRES